MSREIIIEIFIDNKNEDHVYDVELLTPPAIGETIESDEFGKLLVKNIVHYNSEHLNHKISVFCKKTKRSYLEKIPESRKKCIEHIFIEV